MSFRRMGDKATRRAASSFFFELLVLATRDCVKVSQDRPYANIEVRAKPKLWDVVLHEQGDAEKDMKVLQVSTACSPAHRFSVDTTR